ncbi:MAG: sulfurtransferase [Myxococcota bacterium]
MSLPHTTLIDAGYVASWSGERKLVIVDCRFSLRDVEAGRAAWREATIPGAVYAHLDEDLSGPVVPGTTGRHPLPDVDRFAALLGSWGVDGDTQVVAFDDMGGPFAARLWWMLRYVGHDTVAVLDGGLAAWEGSGHPTAPGAPPSASATFAPNVRPQMLATTADVVAALDDPEVALLDARSAARYRGEQETTDPVAGHIPTAISAPFVDNLAPDQRFLPTAPQRRRFRALLAGAPSARAICYCGSGVTACHNLLAIEMTGQPMPRLYVGSWSEWITDPTRPRE